jgi:hypothetical protein
MRSTIAWFAVVCALAVGCPTAVAAERIAFASSPGGSPFIEEKSPAAEATAEALPGLVDGYSATCGAAADVCSPCEAICEGPSSCFTHRWTFFGEYLLLRPRDAAVAYGVAFNGPVTSPPDVPIQIAKVGVVDFDYQSAFRVGFSRALDNCTSLGASYTHFDTSNLNTIGTTEPFVVRSMVSHPSTLTATSDGLDAAALYSLNFNLADLDGRWMFYCNQRSSISLLGGLRYASLNQEFLSQFAVNGDETVATNLKFEGGGIRVGLEGERKIGCHGLMVYGRGTASFLGGSMRGSYAQGQAFDASVVDTGWKAGRVVDILELELGIGWTGPRDRLRFLAGYQFSAWGNMVKTDQFIQAVQTNNFVDLGKTDSVMTFDGMFIRAELRL